MWKRNNDKEEKALIEKANMYQDAEKGWAWKDLMKKMEDIKQKSFQEVDRMPVNDLTPQSIAEARGRRNCIEEIKRYIQFSKEVI